MQNALSDGICRPYIVRPYSDGSGRQHLLFGVIRNGRFARAESDESIKDE